MWNTDGNKKEREKDKVKVRANKYFIFIVPCIVIFFGITNRCDNV